MLYAAISTRPDITHAVVQVSKHNANPNQQHWIAVQRIMRYLKRFPNVPLVFGAAADDKRHGASLQHASSGVVPVHMIEAFCDADWAGDRVDRKSTTGYIIKVNGSVVSWASKKQDSVTLSTAEAEYMAITATAQEVRWIKQLLTELANAGAKSTDFNCSVHATIYTDNQSAMAIATNNSKHGRSKHIDIRYYFVRDDITAGLYKLNWVSSQQNPADVFTKALGPIAFNNCRDKITGGC